MGLVVQDSKAAAPVSLAEVKSFLRIGNSDEDALLAGLVRTATELCEAFTGLVLIEREMTEVIPASSAWTRLSPTPVRAIQTVAKVGDGGAQTALAAGSFAMDIDSNGDGWIRVIEVTPCGRLSVALIAGLASDWNGVPEALRQGIVRLVGHLHAHRDAAADVGPPFAVTALWRPWRRMRLG
jgi:uncharacterized phiE125 gp8 family phage protein